MSRDIMVSVPARDFIASGPGTVGADPNYSNLQVTHAAVGFVEWSVQLPSAGKWRLHVLMTAVEKRPCTLTINGVKQPRPILDEITGGWQSDKLQWFLYGPYDFKQGDNQLRIDFTSGQSCIKEFGFSFAETLAVHLPWRLVPGSGNIIGLTALKDGTVVGVGADNFLLTLSGAAALSQAGAEPPAGGWWTKVPGSNAVIAVTQLQDGTILGVGTDNALYTRPALAGSWTQVPSSKAVKAVTQRRDGTIVGVGMNNALYTRATLTSPWIQVPSSGSVISVHELADSVLVGVGTDRLLYTRTALTDPWTRVPSSGSVTSLAQLADGTLLGAGTDMQLYVASPLKQQASEPTAKDDAVLRATGLEDYGYWLRWKQSLPAMSGDGKPFRRGVVWK